MNSKEQQLLEEAYNEVSFFKDKPEPLKDERQEALSFIQLKTYITNIFLKSKS
jgi:hypothetical protein